MTPLVPYDFVQILFALGRQWPQLPNSGLGQYAGREPAARRTCDHPRNGPGKRGQVGSFPSRPAVALSVCSNDLSATAAAY